MLVANDEAHRMQAAHGLMKLPRNVPGRQHRRRASLLEITHGIHLDVVILNGLSCLLCIVAFHHRQGYLQGALALSLVLSASYLSMALAEIKPAFDTDTGMRTLPVLTGGAARSRRRAGLRPRAAGRL
jgi:hypothetical protein